MSRRPFFIGIEGKVMHGIYSILLSDHEFSLKIDSNEGNANLTFRSGTRKEAEIRKKLSNLP